MRISSSTGQSAVQLASIEPTETSNLSEPASVSSNAEDSTSQNASQSDANPFAQFLNEENQQSASAESDSQAHCEWEAFAGDSIGIFRGDRADCVTVTGHNNYISGGGGNDKLSSFGMARIDGGDGKDILSVSEGSSGSTLNGGDGSDWVQIRTSVTGEIKFEPIRHQSSNAFQVTVGSGENQETFNVIDSELMSIRTPDGWNNYRYDASTTTWNLET